MHNHSHKRTHTELVFSWRRVQVACSPCATLSTASLGAYRPPFSPIFDCVCGAQCAPIFFVSWLNSLFSKQRCDALLCGYISAPISERKRARFSFSPWEHFFSLSLSLSLSLSAFTRLVLHNFNFINTFNAFLSAHIP